jgi:hypothetical protein
MCRKHVSCVSLQASVPALDVCTPDVSKNLFKSPRTISHAFTTWSQPGFQDCRPLNNNPCTGGLKCSSRVLTYEALPVLTCHASSPEGADKA